MKRGTIDLRPAWEPQCAVFRHNLAAVFCHGPNGLTLDGIEVRWAAEMPEDFTSVLWCEQTNHVVIDGFRGRQPGPGDGRAAIRLDEVRGLTVRNSQAPEGTTTFLRHRGVTGAGLFGNNDPAQAASPITPLPSPAPHPDQGKRPAQCFIVDFPDGWQRQAQLADGLPIRHRQAPKTALAAATHRLYPEVQLS